MSISNVNENKTQSRVMGGNRFLVEIRSCVCCHVMIIDYVIWGFWGVISWLSPCLLQLEVIN